MDGEFVAFVTTVSIQRDVDTATLLMSLFITGVFIGAKLQDLKGDQHMTVHLQFHDSPNNGSLDPRKDAEMSPFEILETHVYRSGLLGKWIGEVYLDSHTCLFYKETNTPSDAVVEIAKFLLRYEETLTNSDLLRFSQVEEKVSTARHA